MYAKKMVCDSRWPRKGPKLTNKFNKMRYTSFDRNFDMAPVGQIGNSDQQVILADQYSALLMSDQRGVDAPICDDLRNE